MRQIRDFIKKKLFPKTVARHITEYVTLIKKKGKRAGLPNRVRSQVPRVHGWMADTTRASKLQFFFCSGSFFFFFFFFFVTQVRQVKVVFLRTLRNAATRLGRTEFSSERAAAEVSAMTPSLTSSSSSLLPRSEGRFLE